MSDIELQNAFEELKNRVRSVEKDLQEKTLLEVLPESFAITREASKRILKMRHFDVQLIGGHGLKRWQDR